MMKMNWSQCPQLMIMRRRSIVIVGISSKPRTSSKKRQRSARPSASRESAGTLIATWLNLGFPDG